MRLLFFLIAVLIPCFLKAQNQNTVQWAWTNNYSNQNNSIASDIIVDDNDNIYVVGYYRDTLDIDTITLYGPSNNDDPFIAKFNANGEVQWAKRVEWGNYINDILIDGQGNIRMLISNTYMITYNSANGLLEELTAMPYTSTAGGSEFAVHFGIAPNNHLYVVSQSGLNVNPSTAQVRYYDNTGGLLNELWSRSFEIGNSSFPFGGFLSGFDVDSNGSLFLSGSTENGYALDLVSDSIVSNTTGNFTQQCLFIVSYDTLGEVQWLDTVTNFDLELVDMKMNLNDSSLYITGHHYLDEIIHGDTLTVAPVNDFQMYLAKYDLNGNYEWVKSYSLETPSVNLDPSSSNALFGTELAITDSGYVYIKGGFSGSVIWNADTLYEDTSIYYPNYLADDVFFTKLDSSGNTIWGKYAGNRGGSGNDSGGFWIDEEYGTLYMVGFNIDINKQPYSNQPTRGIFIAKEVGGPISTVSIPELDKLDSGIFVYPNPANTSITIQKNNSNADIKFSLVNLNGQEIISGKLTKEKETVNLSTLHSGVYFLKTSLGTIKIVKQ